MESPQTSLRDRFIQLAFIEQRNFHELELALGISRNAVSQLYEELKQKRDEINKVRALYNRKGYKSIPFSRFYETFQSYELKCCYCEITQDQIDQLFASKQVFTKREKTRGRSLELERVKPNEKYDVPDNLKLACYWCNNAKSDEFTEEEFIPIAKQIRKVWDARLPK